MAIRGKLLGFFIEALEKEGVPISVQSIAKKGEEEGAILIIGFRMDDGLLVLAETRSDKVPLQLR